MATRKRKKKGAISSGIKRPGALTSRAKRNGNTVNQQARKDVKSGSTLAKRQGAYYLNVLKPASKKRKKRSK